MKKLLPIILLLIGTGAGVGAGVFLRPPPEEPAEAAAGEDVVEGEEGEKKEKKEKTAETDEDGEVTREYVKMSNQFIIPVVENGAVASVVLLSLSIEVMPGNKEIIFLREPKIRDSFLQVLFDHANVGGFKGSFTDVSRLDVLRAALREIAIRDTGDFVTDVLILEMARQDY